MIKHSVRYFNNQEIRAVWDNDQSKWWYSAVDLIKVLVEPNSARRYWNNVKVRNPELFKFCKQLKLYAKDGKRYISDVISEEGLKMIVSIIPSKYKKEIIDWVRGTLDPLDEQSKRKAYELYKTSLISVEEIGKTIALKKIHAYLFEGLYPFAGQIRTKNILKNGFVFANAIYLPRILSKIDNMPEGTFEQIVEKYVEMNIAHPFMEGNGRSTRIWLDLIFIKKLKKCVDWSLIDKKKYFDAMKESHLNDSKIKYLINNALTNKINDRELFMKGIDTSYCYEEE